MVTGCKYLQAHFPWRARAWLPCVDVCAYACNCRDFVGICLCMLVCWIHRSKEINKEKVQCLQIKGKISRFRNFTLTLGTREGFF